MRITDLLRQGSVSQSEKQAEAARTERKQESDSARTEVGAEGDSVTVTISELAHRLFGYSELLDRDKLDRSARVQALKGKVESGEYTLPADQVARSIWHHIANQ